MPDQAGFDEYCLWQLDKRQSRYADPLIIRNGEYMSGLEEKYGPDIFCDFILDFIDRNKNNPANQETPPDHQECLRGNYWDSVVCTFYT